MTHEEALALLALPQEQAVREILALAGKAALWEQSQAKASHDEPSPTQPSGMTPPYKKAAKRKKNRKPGQKKGHAGQRRPRPDHIDGTPVHRLECCPDCGHTLGDACREHHRTIEDIPPVTPQVHQHLIKGSWCSHCRKVVTPRVTDALPRATLGLNVVIYSAWLHYLLGVSVGNISRLLLTGYAFKVSPGGLTQAWAKQRCFFHLFTELLKVDKRNDHPPWHAFRRRLSRLLKDAMRLNNQRMKLDDTVFERRKHRINQRLDQLIADPYDDDDARRLAKRLKNFRGELLTFLDHEGVPPTNNLAEQQMRKPVVARKVCQQNRSDRGAKTHAILLSIFRTAELQGQQPVDYAIALTKAAIAGEPLQFTPESSMKEAA